MSFGISFAGGGARGAAHVGVLMALEEYSILPNSVSGASAGSVIAGLYALGMPISEMKEVVEDLSKTGNKLIDPDIFGIIRSLFCLILNRKINVSGIFKGKKFEDYLGELTRCKNIKEIKMPIVIPAVDIRSGNTIAYTNSQKTPRQINGVAWKDDVLICEAIRASCSVPAVFQPKIIENMCLVDGGVTDNLPVELLIAAGERKVLSVDISQNYKIPKENNIIEVAAHSLSIMRSRLNDCISSGERLLIKPKLPDEVKLLSFDRMMQCVEAGYEATISLIPTIKTVFNI
jgi:NTE family protein